MSANDPIRYRILQILYDYYHGNPRSAGLNRKSLLQLMNLPENQVDSNLLYLEQKGLVNLIKDIEAFPQISRITAFGIDVIEHKERYKDQLPFIQIQEIRGDVYGTVVQAKDSQVIIQIGNTFQRANDLTKIKADVAEDLKREIEEYLTSLEEEVQKEKPDAGRIQRLWGWLKNNADWVVPILRDIVLEALRRTIV